MLKKEEKLSIVKTAVILFIITAISAGLLAYINSVTAPIINDNNIKKQVTAMGKVLANADFDVINNLRTDDMDKAVTSVYKDKNNQGYAVMVSPVGYGGEISMVVGVLEDGAVCGVDIISQSETAGLGAKCTQSEFLSQFTGTSEGVSVAKGNAKDNQINAISSATITSKAVTNGVNIAIDAVNTVKEAAENEK